MSSEVGSVAFAEGADPIRAKAAAICPRVDGSHHGGRGSFRRRNERKRQRRRWDLWDDEGCVFDVPPSSSSSSSSSSSLQAASATAASTATATTRSTGAPARRTTEKTDAHDADCDAPAPLAPRGPSIPSSLPRLLAQREVSGGIIVGSAQAGAAGAPSSPLPPRLLPAGASSSLSSRSRIVAWQRHVTARLTVAYGGGPGRRFEFRGAVRRRIPFTQLGTPPLAAVLGLERYGSYCLALGDLDHPIAETDGSGIRGEPAASAIACLALRLYGIPSPAALLRRSEASALRRNGDPRGHSRGAAATTATPLLLTIPLHRAPHEEFLSLTARIPTSLCVSSDWSLGAAWLRVSPGGAGGSTGARDSLVVFPLPSCFPTAAAAGDTTTSSSSSAVVGTLRLDPATASLFPSPTSLRKVLWKVERLPVSDSRGQSGAPLTSTESPGHLLLVRQTNHSCYRLTWIRNATYRQSMEREDHRANVLRTHPSTAYVVDGPTSGATCCAPSLLTPMVDPSGWKECWSDRYTGIDRPSGDGAVTATGRPHPLRIAGEAWLRWDAVLSDILRRRPNFLAAGSGAQETLKLPPFSCDIVQVSDGGSSVQGVICFDSGKRMIYAVFVEVELFPPGSYREVKWTRRERSSSGEPLDLLAESLSLNQRLSLERIGPCGAEAGPSPGGDPVLRDWSSLCTGRSVEPDEWTARDPRLCRERWRPLLAPSSSEVGPVGTIPYDAVYPDAQVFDNFAVIGHVPVRSLRSRSTGLELVYG